MLVGVVSDTHIPSRSKCLPVQLLRAFERVDLILHAGDLTTEAVLEELQAVAPVVAVRGNMCDWALTARLPEKRVVSVAEFSVGLTHGHRGRGRTTPERARLAFAEDEVDAVVFGHSHQPLHEVSHGVVLFNPGSPTDRRRAPAPTYGLLRAEESLTGELLELHP